MLKYYSDKFLPIMEIINGSFTQSDLLNLVLHLLDTFKNRFDVCIEQADFIFLNGGSN